MLLKFNESDMLNTQLVDVTTGEIKFMLFSRASYIQGKDRDVVDVASRTTSIMDVYSNDIVATIEWTGREKRTGGIIKFMNEGPVMLSDLFDGCESVTSTDPNSLVVPTRLGYTWVATKAQLFCCSESRRTVVKYHERCMLIGDSLAASRVPGIGKDYLELESSLSKNEMVELIVDYVFMNIMRRTRFDLPRYKFPLVDGSEEARHSIADVISHVKGSIARRTASFRRGTI